ncbi:acyl carrier protein [Streptomyces sp. 6N223]|uniref:acyl carrier protein n=1 Tax=Streptomyces sp. 6N223 TaxID=3457412 RepID=UPI003FD28A02
MAEQLTTVDAPVDIPAMRDAIREIVMAELEVEPGELNDEGHFVDEYDADSLSLITIVSRVEKELGVRVPKTELKKMTNLAATFGVVEAHVDGEAVR